MGTLIHEGVFAERLWAAIRVCACGRDYAVAIAGNHGCEQCGVLRRQADVICWSVQPPMYPTMYAVCALGSRRLKNWSSSNHQQLRGNGITAMASEWVS